MPLAQANYRRTARRPHRRGFAVVFVIVVIFVAITLFGLWARSIVRDLRRSESEQYRLQATRLAEAGIRRAIVQRAANDSYDQETWAIPATDLTGRHAGQVSIRVAQGDSPESTEYIATADYPTSKERRARITKRLVIVSPTAETGT